MGIKETFRKACTDIKSTAKKVTDSVKGEYKKNQLKNELDEMYLTLGKIRYTELSEQKENTEEGEKIYAEITRLLSEIETIEADGEKQKLCEVCGKELPEDIAYCPYCGTEIKREEATE